MHMFFPLSNRDRVWRSCLWILAVCGWMGLAGCREQPARPASASTPAPVVATPQRDRDYFGMAIDFLKQRDEHNMERSAAQSNYYLNRWIRDRMADPRWSMDPLLSTLPEATRRAPATKEMCSERALAGLEFALADVLFLEENRWLHAVAEWAGQEPPPALLGQWIKDDSGLSAKSARSLAACTSLFDWTVRNIQLDELLPYPRQTTAGPMAGPESDPSVADWTPPMRGEPGPGYDKQPWHVLFYGRGDAYQRARVFLLLARQLRVDGVMLGIDTKTGRAHEWLPALLLDQQLYLFDTELGLPLPGPGGVGIATLAQVVADPQLLASLDIGDKYRYRVRGSDLGEVVALVDASPQSLSQRMKLVEQQLTSADQMILSYSAARVKQELAGCSGLKDVRLWAVPVEAATYQQARSALLARDENLQWQEFLDHGVFMGLSAVVRGRREYLLGHFDKHGDQAGAISFYLGSRLSNLQIEEIERNPDMQKTVGLEKTIGMTEEQWAQRIAQIQRLQTESKKHAAYWLGLLHMERRNYDVAVNWLKVRTLESDPEGPWRNGARYNLARCYEALGRTAEARQLYLIDESPQRHGCLLRARQLEADGTTSSETAGP